MKKIKNLYFEIFVIAFLFGILNLGLNLSEGMMINISTDKSECYVGENVTINVTIIPDKKGVYAFVSLSKINGSIENLIYYPRGCAACGLKRSPLTSFLHRQFYKKFDEKGIYEVFGEIESADDNERNSTSLRIIVKENVTDKIEESNTNKSNYGNILEENFSNKTNTTTNNTTTNATINLSNKTRINEISNKIKEIITDKIYKKIKTKIIYFTLKFIYWI